MSAAFLPKRKMMVFENSQVKSSLKMGVVGLPNVGKSSLFNLLTNQAVDASNYPFIAASLKRKTPVVCVSPFP